MAFSEHKTEPELEHELAAGNSRRRVVVRGIVQGVGFRPYVYRIANELGLSGFVGNDAGGVFIEVEGAMTALELFSRRLEVEAPPLAHIDEVIVTPIQARGESGFQIVHSTPSAESSTLVRPIYAYVMIAAGNCSTLQIADTYTPLSIARTAARGSPLSAAHLMIARLRRWLIL